MTGSGPVAPVLSADRSDFLHALRWLSALVVVVGHVQMYHHIVSGRPADPGSLWEYLGSHGHYAVMVFFVLSGFVVAYATEVKEARVPGYGLRLYLADRWSRIYSVLLPAIVFTIALDVFGDAFFSAYSDPELIPQDYYLFRVATNLFGLQGVWGWRIQMGSNPALWSIGYELAFYALWGIFHFRHTLWAGSPAILALLGLTWVAVFGWTIAWYFLLWLLGVMTWRIVASKGFVSGLSLPVPLMLVAMLAGNHLINYAHTFASYELVNDSLFAILVAVFLCFNPRIPGFVGDGARRVNRWMADFSYSLYAYHLPIIFFLAAFLNSAEIPYRNYAVECIALLVIPMVAARALYYITEARRSDLRAFLLRIAPGRTE